jgi:hypothetical protein
MSGLLGAFDDYRRSGVSRFVQTALVIDNEAEMRPSYATPPVSRPATRGGGSVLKAAHSTDLHTGSDSFPHTGSESIIEAIAEQPSHQLNAKHLTDAWSERAVICGLYRPERGEDMVARATKAAAHADVVIIDWFLEGASSVRAKEIIVNILKNDLAENGRLRLLAVYTSQSGVSIIAKEILEAAEEAPELKNLLRLEGSVLTGPSVRICVLSKPQAVGMSDVDKVDEGHLPNRLIAEFAYLSIARLSTNRPATGRRSGG